MYRRKDVRRPEKVSEKMEEVEETRKGTLLGIQLEKTLLKEGAPYPRQVPLRGLQIRGALCQGRDIPANRE